MATSLRILSADLSREEGLKHIELSVVVPIYNEEENIKDLYGAIKPVLEQLGRPCEIIFVDDGSKDSSFEILRSLHESDNSCKVIRFRRNFGQTAAMAAGFAYAKGDIIITLDGDLQNDPKDIPILLDKIENGYDVVSGWRVRRKDKFFTRKLPSVCANWLISKITGVNLHDYGCTLKAYRREVAQNIDLYGEMHRFIPAMASWMGVSVAEVQVDHHPRIHGVSKYGLSRTIRVMLDLITVKFLLSYFNRPLRAFGTFGFISSFLGFSMGIYLTIHKFLYAKSLSDRPMLFLSILLILVGIQFISMGLLGEMMVRIYHEGQDKPIYVVRDKLD